MMRIQIHLDAMSATILKLVAFLTVLSAALAGSCAVNDYSKADCGYVFYYLRYRNILFQIFFATATME
jgi:hypothetical protein